MLRPTLVPAAVTLSLLSTARAALPDPLFATYWGQSTEQSLSSYCALGYFDGA